MPDKPWYQEWFSSPFYHKLYLDRNEAEASAFIQKMVTHLSPAPASRMLDVACGKGRHSRILASMGYPVTGIDLSFESIAAAKQFETDSLDFFVHDMRLPFWGNYFNFAFNLFTSFGYFKTRREHDDAMRTIAKSLKPGGRLVIDYLNVHHTEENLQYNETRQVNGTTYEIHRWDDETHFFKKITVIDPSILEPLSFIEQVAKFTLGDFTDMLSFQGLQVQEVYGDYQFSPYDIRKTPRLIVVASKGTPEQGDKEKRIYSDGRTTDPLT